MSLISLFVPILIIILIVFLARLRPRRTKTYIPRKWGMRLLALYGLFLVAAWVYVHVVPNPKIITKQEVSIQEMNQIQQASNALLEQASQGDWNKWDGVIVKKHWSFTFTRKTLKVISPVGVINENIIVKEQPSLNHQIKITEYTTRSVVNRIDITNKILAPSITLSGSSLQVHPPAQVNLQFAEFGPEFTVAQFSKGPHKGLFESYSGPSILGYGVLYIQVPKGVTVWGDHIKILKD